MPPKFTVSEFIGVLVFLAGVVLIWLTISFLGGCVLTATSIPPTPAPIISWVDTKTGATCYSDEKGGDTHCVEVENTDE